MNVKVGMVSFAHIHAYEYAPILGSLDSADLIGVTDDDARRGREAAERFGVRFFEDQGELFEAADAVVVCSETANHRRDVAAALTGGAHVLCEKPISTGVEDAKAMIQASRESGRQLRIAFPVRYLPAVRRAREIIDSGALGRILAATGANPGQNPGGWFIDAEMSGGGAVMDHTVHVADALRWMLGAEVESVYAEVGSLFGAEEIDDAGILTLELAGGTIADGAFATIDPSWSRGAGYPTWGDVTFRIAGTAGVLNVDGFADRLTTFDHERGNTAWSYTGEDMNALMMEDFLRGVAEGSPRGASGEDGLRALEVVLAAYRSGEAHEPVSLERA